MSNKFKTIEEDSIIVYDESDDFDPEETQILDEEDELDTDYLLRETARQEARHADERRRQSYISAGVIAAVIIFIGAVCLIGLRNIL